MLCFLNKPKTLINKKLVSIFALLMMSESLSDIFGIKLSDGSSARDVFAFITGYLNHSIIKNVLRILKK